MAVLPTPGSPISTGLFLVRRESTWITRRISSSRPITGSSLPRARQRGQVAAVLLQRLVGGLGVLAGHALAAAHLAERRQQLVACQVELAQDAHCLAADVRLGHPQQQVLSREVIVLEGAHLVLGALQRAPQPRRRAELLGVAAGGGQGVQRRLQRARHLGQGHAHALQHARHHALRLLNERQQQVLGLQLGIAPPLGQLLGAGDGIARALGVEVEVHLVASSSRKNSPVSSS